MKKINIFMAVLLVFFLSFATSAEARVETITTPLSGNSNQSISIDLNNFVKINNVRVDTGNVNYTMNGNRINLNMSGGSIKEQTWDSTYYNKFVTAQTNSYYSDSSGYSGSLYSYVYSGYSADSSYASDSRTSSSDSFSSSLYYSSGNYSGNLTKSGGSYVSSGSYTPSDSKFVYMTMDGSSTFSYRCVNKKLDLIDSYSTDVQNQTYTYNSGGYSGTYNTTGSVDWGYRTIGSGSQGAACSTNGATQTLVRYNKVYFSALVVKPAVDTRVYRQDYSGYIYRPDTQVYRYQGTVYAGAYTNIKYNYIISVDYVDNRAPILIGSIDGGNYSDKAGYNTLNVNGSVTDEDGDISTIKYKVGNKTGTIASNIADGGNFSGSIVIDNQVSEGPQNVLVWADDGKPGGESIQLIKNIIVDKTHPTITHTLSPSSWTTGNVIITPTGVDPSGVRSVSPTSTLATDNGTYNFNTEDVLDNKGIRGVTVTTIDRIAPTITIVSDGNNTYEKSHSTIVNVVDTRDGSNVGSGNKKLEYSWSTDPNVPGTYTEFTTGNTITTPVGVTGDYYLHIKAEDNLGQVSNNVSNVFKVDNTIPEVGNLVLSLDGVGRILANISGINDLHAGTEVSTAHSYRLDSGSYTSWTGNSNLFTGLQGNRVYGITYKIRDKAGNEAIVSIPKNLRSMTFHPVGLNITGLNANSITLNITEGNNVLGSSYEIYTKDLSGAEVGTESTFSNSLTNRKVSDLGTNIKYSIWARSKNIDGVSTLPDIKLLENFSGADVPGLKLSSVTISNMVLNIDKNLNPIDTQYYVERALDSNFTSGKVVLNNWTASLNVSSTGLVSGQTYYYRIKARNGDNAETNWSEVYSFKSIPSQVVLAQPTVSAYDHSKNDTDIKLNWTGVLGADKYYIYRNGLKVGEVSGSELTYVDSLGEFNDNTIYNVSAWNAQGEGTKSTERSLYSRARNIGNLEVINLTDTVATFKVNNSSKNTNLPSTFIEIRRKDNGTLVTSSAFSKNVDSRVLSGLRLGTAYEVWVTVRNENNISNPAVKVIDEFYMNRPPEINLELENDKYSEIVGYDKIKVRGKVKDLDTIPVGDPLDIYYTIKNSRGSVVSGHNNINLGRETATGDWQNISYDIPLTTSLVEGNYTIEVRVIDDQLEQVIDIKPFLVDRTIPVGKLKEVNGPKSYELTNEIYDVDGNIAGLHDTPYSIHRSVNKKPFEELVTWRDIIDYKDNLINYKLESNTKYSYKAKIRDQVGHVAETNLVEFVTSPKVKDRDEDYLVNDPSSLVIEWEKPLIKSDEVSIEVRRNGHLIAVLVNGDSFIDSNLDYERDYKYQLIAVSETFDGKRLASVPIDLTLTTGLPLIEFTLDTNYIGASDLYEINKTIFSEYAYVGSEVFYRPGGDVNLSYEDNEGTFSELLRLSPYETRKYPLSIMILDAQKISLRAVLESKNVDLSVDIKAVGKLKLPEIENIDSNNYINRVDN